MRLVHLLHRVEKHAALLIRPPIRDDEDPISDLGMALITAFEKNHLFLNNFECYYTKGLPDIELEQKFSIDGDYNYHIVNREFYQDLSRGHISDFVPQIGDEIQHWSYDNDFFEIVPDAGDKAGYISIMHWSRKRKEAADEKVVTLKKKLFDFDALERWERNYSERPLKQTAEETIEEFFPMRLKRLPSWRRTRYDIACESLRSGNIFMVNFEDSRINEESGPYGRVQQCEIEYLKTRGRSSPESIYRDLEALTEHVTEFMQKIGLRCERTNYSKLQFLRDYKSRCAPDVPGGFSK